MPGRRRLTTLLYAFPERTERCSFPTPSTPVLPFYSSPSSFFLRPPPSPPPPVSPSSPLYLSLSLPFILFLSISILHPMFRSSRYTPPCRAHFLPFLPLLSIVLVCAVSSRNGGIGKENESYIYTRFSSSSSSPYSLSPLPILSYPLPSGRDYRNSTVFHSLTPFLPSLCSFFRRHRIIRAR